MPKDGEKISNLTDGITEELQNLFADWKSRLDIVQNTVSVVDPIINVRKVSVTENSVRLVFNGIFCKSWLFAFLSYKYN